MSDTNELRAVKLTELLERCEKATKPDYPLSAEIAGICGAQINSKNCLYGRWEDDPTFGYYSLPNYTRSIGEALWLVERTLPGWGWRVERYGHTCEASVVRLAPRPDDRDEEWHAVSHTAPLAILAALLRALLSTSDARAPSVEEGKHG